MRFEIATKRRAAGGWIALLAWLALAPTPAGAARLVDVRVGVHPGFARVVFETDAAAAHDVVEQGASEVVVRIEAASAARAIAPRSDGAPSVELVPTADGATLARIKAAGPLRVETQVLAAPPRVVLDLRRAETATSPPAPEPEPQAVAEADAPSEPPAPSEPAAPEAVVAPPPGEPVAEAAAEPPREEAPPPTPEAVASPAPPKPAPEPPADLPPVDAAPPASLSFEPRSLATGLAIGFAIALFVFAVRRPAPRAPGPAATEAAPEIAAEPAPIAAEPALVAAVEAAPEPIFEEPEDGGDFARMHRRLDARLADLAAKLDSVTARQEHLDATGAAHGLEIASQRAAIARLRRTLQPAPEAPRDAEREDVPPTARPR